MKTMNPGGKRNRGWRIHGAVRHVCDGANSRTQANTASLRHPGSGLRAIGAALAFACLLAFGAQTALAQDATLDLSHLDKLEKKATEVTNVNLEGPMLQMAAHMVAQNAAKSVKGKDVDEWTQKMEHAQHLSDFLRGLKGIHVRVYEFVKPGEYSHSDLNSVLNQLQSGGWKPMVNVEEKKSGETTNIYSMNEGGETVGMAVVVAEPKELTVVNIVGPMDFSKLGGLGNLGALGKLGSLAPKLQHRDSAKKQDNAK